MAQVHIPPEIEQRARQAAQNRYGYCLSLQHLVMARVEIAHLDLVYLGGGYSQ